MSIRSITFLPAHLRAGRECEVRSLIEYAWGLVRRREGGSVRRKKGIFLPGTAVVIEIRVVVPG